MGALTGFLVISAMIPLAAGFWANRLTSLNHTFGWAIAAGTAWFVSAEGSVIASYFALALTGCAGVAVLGARRPGAAAWNFVPVGLFVVLMVPLAEARALDTPIRLGAMRTVFLACLFGTIVMNYLPTRLFGGAIALGLGCGLELARLIEGAPVHVQAVGCIGLAPWLAWLGWQFGPKPALPCDRVWRRFRDRYGLVWGLRVREQFNRTSVNASRDVELHWSGVRTKDGGSPGGAAAGFAIETLAALTQRFGLR